MDMCLTSTKYGVNPMIPHKDDRPRCSVEGCDDPKAIVSALKDGSPYYRQVCSRHHAERIADKHHLKNMNQVTAMKRGISVSDLNSQRLRRRAAKQGLSVREYNRQKVLNSAIAMGMTVKQYQIHIKLQTAIKAGFANVNEYNENLAKMKGFDSYTAYKNSMHPYLKFRKTYCENVDSRLGFSCTSTIHWDGMLDVDHINGIPNDNRPDNLQTLCKNCHAYKSNVFEDYKTPGRKALGMAC